MFQRIWTFTRQHIGSASGPSDNTELQSALQSEQRALFSRAQLPHSQEGTVATRELASARHTSTSSSLAPSQIPWWSDVPQLQPVYIQPVSTSAGAVAEAKIAPFGTASNDDCIPTVTYPVSPHPVPVPIMHLDAIRRPSGLKPKVASASGTNQPNCTPTSHILPSGLVTSYVPTYNDTTSCATASECAMCFQTSTSERNVSKGPTASNDIGLFIASYGNTSTHVRESLSMQPVYSTLLTEQSQPHPGCSKSYIGDVSPQSCLTTPASFASPVEDGNCNEADATRTEMKGRQQSNQLHCDHVIISMEEDTFENQLAL